jgi:hypothetical protein
MTYQEKNAITSLISTFIVFGIYYFQIFQFYQAGRFDAADANSFLGKAILVLIFGGIVVTIITAIVFNILHAIATNDPKPSFVVDERDQMIELRSTRVSYYVMGAGFVCSMGVLAMGHSPILVFNLIVTSFGIGATIEGVMRLIYYRRGY